MGYINNYNIKEYEMKKTLTILAITVLLISCFAGCAQKEVALDAKITFIDNGDGTMTCLDIQSSPLDGGLCITVDKNEGFINFQITDKDGNATVEYYIFTPTDTTCHRYKYVSAMGTGFNYYYDYNASELFKIENKDNEDTTDSTKESGRFDGAQSETKENVDKLIEYFIATFDSSLEDIVG